VSVRSVILAAVFAASPSLASAPVAADGRTVRIETEEALIIWDAATKTEHFIRRATFDTDAKDFGFLVPTPTQPDLAEASDDVFRHLERVTRPPEAPVTVLERKSVGGLDVALLAGEATLRRWLRQQGYRPSPQLDQWLEPYVAKGWKIGAFKVAGNAPHVETAAVRMSFHTERPFFPYREPANPRIGSGRLLRVYVLAEQRVEGTIGVQGEWPAATRWTSTLPDIDRDRVLQLVALPYSTAPTAFWLTKLEDSSSARAGGADDLYFKPATQQAMIRSAPQARQERGLPWLSIAIAVLLAAGIGAYLWRQGKTHG
jgi:hypothetical protein